ncbi:eukaryotic translation initiation factor 2-alpha kinase 1-like isoform X2 [Limulus polyphemus]|uniref:non-specific serine/threonine protein kinase n=1 Tax=Limulus polyphemus TaxID=6850 RepID=A0ABM1S1B2_LIMPO|nr:eukaryotic translation initiation factor 2-alpha kinase 1-like isoform X2 [Limulus polyphemus]
MECLLEVICQLQECDPVKRKLLYADLYENLKDLTRIKFQNLFNKSSIFDVILKSFEKNGYIYTVIQNSNLKMTDSSLELIPSLSSLQLSSRAEYGDSRYANEFKEIKGIGHGSFGSVFQVRSHLDQNEYAIKKIYCKNYQLKQAQQEVKHFSRLSHPNVVNYKTSWIENDLSPQSSEDTSCENVSSLETSSDRVSEDSLIYFKNSPMFFEEEEGKDYSVPRIGVCQTQEVQKLSSSKVISTCYPTPAERCFNSQYKDSLVKITEITSKTQSSSSSLLNTNASELGEHDSISYNDEGLCDKSINSSVEDLPHYKNQNTRFNSKSYSGFEKRETCIVLKTMDHWSMPLVKESGLLALDRFQNGSACISMLRNLYMQPVTLYIQMELCGMRLKDYLNERNNTEPQTGPEVFSKVDLEEVLNIFQQLLKGVDHIHSKGLIHRDLKPQNILFDIGNNHKVKIGDLGLSTMSSATIDTDYHDDISSHTPNVGTCLYCAPEQKKGSSYDFKADMFSLGVILLELLHPFATEMERVECLRGLQSGIVPSEIEQKWPELTKVIKSLTQTDPGKRPMALEVLNSLSPNKTEIIKDLQKCYQELLYTTEEQKRMLEEQRKQLFFLCQSKDSLNKENQELRIQLQNKELELESLRNNSYSKRT